MGSHFDISIVAKDSATAEKFIDKSIAEITRIENLISEWRKGTQISEVNENAGISPVKVDREVFNIAKKALFFSKITEGAFDPTIAAMDKIWKFDGSMEAIPTQEAVKNAIRYVGYKNVVLDSAQCTIFLKNKSMKIGFGATGKSYAADKTRSLMQSFGIAGGIINASGDIATWGNLPNGKPWKIGLENPFNKGKTLKTFRFKNNECVVTSGDYEKYVEFGGRRYSHIINPKTGYPASGLTSVTVIGPNAETANGISTSVMVLGLEAGRKLLKKFPKYHITAITDKGRTYRF